MDALLAFSYILDKLPAVPMFTDNTMNIFGPTSTVSILLFTNNQVHPDQSIFVFRNNSVVVIFICYSVFTLNDHNMGEDQFPDGVFR